MNRDIIVPNQLIGARVSAPTIDFFNWRRTPNSATSDGPQIGVHVKGFEC